MTSATRTEHDALGAVTLPADAWYGIATARALANFPISGLRAHPALITAVVRIKRGGGRASWDGTA